MNYSLFIAKRLSLSSGKHKSSPAIAVSITAVALSIAIMLASIAIVIGFKREIRDKVVGFNSHITLYSMPTSEDDDNLLTLTPSLKSILDSREYIKGYSLEASIPAIFKTSEDFKGVYFRSLNSKFTDSFIKRNLEEGEIPDYSKNENSQKVLISRIAARQLGLKIGDRIDTYFISNNVKVRPLIVSGIFNTHFDSYDQLMVYGPLSLIQSVAKIPESQGTSIQIFTDNVDRLQEYTADLNNTLVQAAADGMLYKYYRLDNAYNQGAGYFNWLSLLDTNVVVVLTLMIVVAVATLISGMLILILDKKRFIGVARAMGASVAGIRKVFVYLALKVAFYGMIIGNVVMLALLVCQDKWHFLPLDPEAYYIDFVPVEINWWSVLILNISSFVVIYLSLIIPSRFVSRISPAEAIRSE